MPYNNLFIPSKPFSLHMAKKDIKLRVLAFSITLVIIALLVFAGPAGAATLKIDGIQKTPYTVKETVNFKASVHLEDLETLTINSISLVLNNDKKKEEVICTFDINGTVISGCNGINVSLLSNNLTMGFGYFSGEGSLLYNVDLDVDPSGLTIGSNKLSLVVNTPASELASDNANIVVKPATPANGPNSPTNNNKGKNK